MSKPNEGVLKLCEWYRRYQVDKMLDDGEEVSTIFRWIKEQGFSVSMPTIYRYSQERKEAIMRGEDIVEVYKLKKLTYEEAELAKKNKTKPVAEQRKRERKVREKREEIKKERFRTDRVKSDLELLDAVLQKGMETLNKMEAVAPKDFLKAVELKHKITGGRHNNMTVYGFEEIRLREAARESALVAILLEYIPDSKHEEVLARMEEETVKFYENLGLKEQYEKLGELSDI